MVVLAMIGLVLLQRSEGGALGIGGGSGAFLTGRSAGNMLSHTTAYLAIAFFITSLALALLSRLDTRPSDILERLPGQTAPAETTAPVAPPAGAPTSAEEMLQQLGGSSETPSGAEGPASDAAEPAPPAAQEPPSSSAPAPGPQAPPAEGGAGQ
jgi:preprotein translocase subunit SecG